MIAVADLPTLFSIPAFILLAIFAVLCVAIPFHVRAIRKESEKTNKLLRQMIRSGGHEPDA